MIFITGIAGFIGFHVALRFKQKGMQVCGIDSFNSYYDPALKRARAQILKKAGITVYEGDITEKELLFSYLSSCKATHLIHLAAYAGVRNSIRFPEIYIQHNIDGFLQVLEAVKRLPHLGFVYASSSSVYGKNTKVPFSEEDKTDQPANIYGMSKKANELMAFAYHNIYGIPAVGLRFFTVYGPWGRPDMAYFLFTKALFENRPIELYNEGKMRRDFTYIDDIVDGIEKSVAVNKGYHIFNLGNSKPVDLGIFVDILEEATGRKAIRTLLPMPQGEVLETFADSAKSEQILGFKPKVSLRDGLFTFVDWYKENIHLIQPGIEQKLL